LNIAFPESKSTCQPSASDNQHNLAALSSVNWERRRHLSAWARISDALRSSIGKPFEDAEQLGMLPKVPWTGSDQSVWDGFLVALIGGLVVQCAVKEEPANSNSFQQLASNALTSKVTITSVRFELCGAKSMRQKFTTANVHLNARLASLATYSLPKGWLHIGSSARFL